MSANGYRARSLGLLNIRTKAKFRNLVKGTVEGEARRLAKVIGESL